MSQEQIWMVRAGQGAVCVDEFIEDHYVAMGWGELTEEGTRPEKADLEAKLKALYPKDSEGSISNWASQIVRYFNNVSVGDRVTTYDPNNRLYYLGEITSEVTKQEHELGCRREVRWEQQVPRDALQASTRNSLGSIMTLFRVKGDSAADMLQNAVPIDSQGEPTSITREAAVNVDHDLLEEAVARSSDSIEDRIAALDWEQMQELVSEILKAMGYRTRVAPKGADRGVDVFASPDGLGLQEPRIFVEVKHRPGTKISAELVRAFLGGRQLGDRCLYVSTGGFSREARYEAERSSIPVTLITLPQLRELLVEHYENLGPSGTTLIPLEKIYLPA